MIIACEKCGARFRLDASLLNSQGSRVRCSLCRHVFTQFPPVPEPAVDSPPSDKDAPSMASQEPDPESEGLEMADSEPDPGVLDDTGGETDAERPVAADAPDRLAGPETDWAPVPPEDDEMTFGTLTVTDDDRPGRSPDIDDPDQGLSGSGASSCDVPPPPRRPARASLIQPLDPEGSLGGFPDAAARKKSILKLPFPALLIIVCLAAGAYITAGSLGYNIPFLPAIQIPQIQQYLPQKGSDPLPAPDPVPDQKTVTGRFITNDAAGELFIITGRVENPSQIPYRRIEVKGTLFQKEKTEAMTQTAFCGIIVPEAALKTGDISDIITQLQTPRETADIDARVMPGDSVPFMLVFSDLPHNLENFTVEVVGFEKTDP